MYTIFSDDRATAAARKTMLERQEVCVKSSMQVTVHYFTTVLVSELVSKWQDLPEVIV